MSSQSKSDSIISSNDNTSIIDSIDNNTTNIIGTDAIINNANTSTSDADVNTSSPNPFVNNANDHYKFFARLFEVTEEDTPPPELADDNDSDNDNDIDNDNSDDKNVNTVDDNNEDDIDSEKNDEKDDNTNNDIQLNTATNMNNIFTIKHNFDAITIQRVYRGRLGRKKRDRTKVIRHRERIQERYATQEGVYRFYFEQMGAAAMIQRWYRRLPWLVKKKWKKKYAKTLEKTKYEKFQRQKDKAYNRKLAALAFLDGSLDDYRAKKELISFSIILTRFARGLTVRRKLKNTKIKSIKIVIIQSVVRAFLVHCRLPKLGARTRMRQRKERKWKKLSQIVYPKHLLRRPEIFFPHLIIGDEKNIDLMGKKAFVLNRAWRAYKVRRRFRQIQEDKKLRRAIRIQRWYITIRFRKQLRKSLFLLQPFVL